MPGQARIGGQGQGHPCRADSIGHEQGDCCGARLCQCIPELWGNPPGPTAAEPLPHTDRATRRLVNKTLVTLCMGALLQEREAPPVLLVLPHAAPSLQALGPLPGRHWLRTEHHCDLGSGTLGPRWGGDLWGSPQDAHVQPRPQGLLLHNCSDHQWKVTAPAAMVS